MTPLPPASTLAGLRDMALTRARVARHYGDRAAAVDNLCLAYWCRGMLRKVAPRPWGRSADTRELATVAGNAH